MSGSPSIKRFLAALTCSAIVVLAPAAAQTRRAVTLVDLAELPRVIDPQISPDGQLVTYMLSHADWKANRPIWHLWRQPVAGGRPLRLTTGGNGEVPGTTRWSPDGKTIAFVRDGQIMLIAAEGGEPRPLTRHVTGVSSPSWSPDGQSLYFLASDPRTADERERDRLRDDVMALDENYKPRRLWRVTLAGGAEQALTGRASEAAARSAESVLAYRVSRDGTRIALEVAPTPLAGDAYRGEIWVMDASGANAKALTRNEVEEGEPELSPDNSLVLFLADANARLQPYYNTNLFLVPATGGVPRPLLPDFPYAFERATWAPDGASILASVNMGVHSEVFRIDVSSRSATQLTNGEHGIPPPPAPAWVLEPKANRLVFLFDEPTRFGDVWTLSLSGDAPVRVTGVFDALERDFKLPRQEKVEWTSRDGTTIEGLLFYPADYEAGRRYPLVVQMHGGPQESDKFGAGAGLVQNYFPVLTARGFAVLRPNYRGSAGYGNTFYRDVVGGYFRNMQFDILAGVDALIKRGLADPDRLVLMGWSAGGHLTNKLITMTTRFKAASAGAGASDWTSMYGQTDIRANRSIWFGGTPWQKNAPIATFWNNSPLKDVAAVRTPTLFFVGENDARVPLPQSQEMHRALKTNGVPTHLYVAPREGHQWGELRHLIFKANAELEWFEKYALGRVYTWEKAPGDGDAPPNPPQP
ncbi:MAG: S9 family peptidase [Vicinamibacterales bacterium]